MAFTLHPAAALVYSVRDNTGSVGRLMVHIPSATLVADAKTKADALAPLIAAVVGVSIINYGVTYVAQNGAPAGALAGCEVEQKGVLLGRAANGLPVKIEVPGFLHTKCLDSGAIDGTDADVIALIAALTGTAPIPCSASGSAIEDITNGYMRFRGSTRWERPRDTDL